MAQTQGVPVNNSTSKVSTIATLVMILLALALFFNVWWKCAKIGPDMIKYGHLLEGKNGEYGLVQKVHYLETYPGWIPYSPAEYEELNRLDP